jgi:hypothetical protein
MCHGSRLICEKHVYNKNFELIQEFDFPEVPQVTSLCSYDRDHLIVGLPEYRIAVLRWDGEQYHLKRRFRFE